MNDENKHVIDWLNDIKDNPESWHMFYSESEVKWLAEKALEMLNS